MIFIPIYDILMAIIIVLILGALISAGASLQPVWWGALRR